MLNPLDDASDLLIRTANERAYWARLNATEYNAFSSYIWALGGFTDANRESVRTVHGLVLSFLNKELKGVDDGLLTQGDPRAAYPSILEFRRK